MPEELRSFLKLFEDPNFLDTWEIVLLAATAGVLIGIYMILRSKSWKSLS